MKIERFYDKKKYKGIIIIDVNFCENKKPPEEGIGLVINRGKEEIKPYKIFK